MASSLLASSPAKTRRRPGRLRTLGTTVLALLGVLAATLTVSAPAGATTLPARTALESRIAWAVKALINSERALHGSGYLYMNSHLQLSARRHNVTMARYNTMSHQLPGEPYFSTRMTQAGYQWSWAGENIAWNSAMTLSGVLTLERLMYNEKAPNDAHRVNILNRHYRDVGVDVYLDPAHHKIWLTTDFGHR
jgi:uncharacterized protein YkwD